tara:strand:- start:31 stop:2232 length:2202 start_codon:yes stop_codon:yes gene_type:complete
MELVEKFSKRGVDYANCMSYDDVCCYLDSNMNTQEKKVYYKKIKNYTSSLIKANYEIKRLYSFSFKNTDKHQGRLFSGHSIQGIPKHIRGLICRQNTTDIDMENAHPKILSYLCKINGIMCPNLDYYINNRDSLLAGFENRDEAKKLFLASINNDTLNRKEKHQFFKAFDKETKMIQKRILALDDYKHFKDEVPPTRKHNHNGSALNKIMCCFENDILQEMISFINHKNIEISALMFDGLMIYGDYYDDKDLLNSLENVINNTYEQLDMTLTYKQHSNKITIPENWNGSNSLQQSLKDDAKAFNNMVVDFEKTHAKIVNKSSFVKFSESLNEFMFFNKKSLVESYEEIKCKRVVKDKDGIEAIKECCFIKEWLLYENIRKYDDVDVYPPPLICPNNIFNLWTGFAMDKIENYEHNQEAIDLFLKHIKILCGNEEHVYEYIIKWIGQMIQFPAIKTTFPLFISGEGAGKGSLIRLFAKMLGAAKVFETSKPSRDVFGNFNGAMKEAFLVNLNELSKREFDGSQDYFKALVTDGTTQINIKNVKTMVIKSFHRFFGSTNNEEAINTPKGDRRNIVIRSSDELIGNKEHFTKVYSYLDDVDAVKSIFEYFKNIPGLSDFHKEKLPVTEYQQDLQEMNANPIELWFQNYIKQNCNQGEYEVKSSDLYDNFNSYLRSNFPSWNINLLQFLCRLKRLNVDGMYSKKSKTIRYKLINIDKCLEHFGLDKTECLVELDDEE